MAFHSEVAASSRNSMLGAEGSGVFGIRQRPSVDPLITNLAVTYPRVGAALALTPELAPLLVPWQEYLPTDVAGSMRGGEIVARVSDELGFSPDLTHAVILGAAFSDVGRLGSQATLWPERVAIYTSNTRWREDPSSREWGIIQTHPATSSEMIVEATRATFGDGRNNPIAIVARHHHTLKRVEPYPSSEVASFGELPFDLQEGIEVVVAADVAEALVTGITGRGRGYLNPREIEGGLIKTVLREVFVRPEVVASVVAHTLLYNRLEGETLYKKAAGS